MSFDWKGLVKGVAPALGTLIGGPAGGLAVTALADGLLGDDSKDMSVEEKQKALEEQLMRNPSPDVLVKIKEIETKFKKDMKAMDIDIKKLELEEINAHAADRDSARQREKMLKDKTPATLAAVVTLGFFAVLGCLIFAAVPAGVTTLLNVILGALCTAWISIIQYYFGSSKGSSDKNFLSALKEEDLRIAKKKDEARGEEL